MNSSVYPKVCIATYPPEHQEKDAVLFCQYYMLGEDKMRRLIYPVGCVKSRVLQRLLGRPREYVRPMVAMNHGLPHDGPTFSKWKN